MVRFGADLMRAKNQSVFSGTLHEETRSIRTKASPTKEEISYQLKIRESRQVIKILRQEELEITEKLKKLKLNRVKLEQKRKRTSSYSHGYSVCNTKENIEWKVREMEKLEHYLCELFVSKRPHQRKDSHICPLDEKFKEQIVKLHKGMHHGNFNLVKERQLHKQIKQTREEIEKITANVSTEPTIQVCTYQGNDLGSKEAITDYIKVTSKEVEELKMIRMRYKAYDGRLDFEQAAMEKEIRILEKKQKKIKQKRFKTIHALKRNIYVCIKGSSVITIL